MGDDVSIVIPCFNGERFVGRTLESARQQRHLLEIIVVDDGSTDRSASIVQSIADSDDRVKLFRGANRGSAAARNVGARALSPESRFVLFLDADDVLAPNAAALLRARLERDSTLAAVVGARSRIDGDGTVIEGAPVFVPFHYADAHKVRKLEFVNRVGYWHMVPICPISTPGQCLIRVADLPPGDVFNERFAPCEDWDLWLRLARERCIGVVNSEVLSYRDHHASASKQYRLMHDQRAAIYRAQVSVVAPEERGRLRTAWRFGMFKFDRKICLQWARARLAERDLAGSARYAQRALRLEARYLWAIARNSPNVDPVLVTAD